MSMTHFPVRHLYINAEYSHEVVGSEHATFASIATLNNYAVEMQDATWLNIRFHFLVPAPISLVVFALLLHFR